MISTSPPVTIPHVSITDYVLRHADRLGDKPALIDGPTGRTLSYRQLAEGARRTAAGLAQRGFGKGQVFAIYCPNIPEYAVVFLGVAMAGGINTTVNPLYTADELATQLNDSGARFLVTVPAFLDKAKAAAAKSKVEEVFVFGAAEGARSFTDLLRAGDTPRAVPIDPAVDLVALPYSSGTTGLPKGVMLTHRNLVANLCQAEARPDIVFPGERDTLLAFLPFFHIYGIVMFLNYGLWRGATIVSTPRFDFEQYLEMVQRFGVTYLHLVP